MHNKQNKSNQLVPPSVTQMTEINTSELVNTANLNYRNVSCQTSINLDFSSFKSFNLNFHDELKKEDFKCLDFLDGLDYNSKEWKEAALDQLRARDRLLEIYRHNLTTLITYGISVEINIEDLQFKVEELNNQIKQLKQKQKPNKIKLTKKTKKAIPIQETKDSCMQINLYKDNKQQTLAQESSQISESINKNIELNLEPQEEINLTNLAIASCGNEEEILHNDEYKDNECQWNSSNIKEEVQSLAETIVKNSGYVFLEECGMYYDSTSGYYYDQNTSLYYDGRSGTYFYYDHGSQSYQFHSQIENLLESNALPQKHEKNKPMETTNNIKGLDLEEGECSNSSNELDEGDMGIYKSPTHEVEELFNPITNAVAPSLRLMVTNGELNGQLHIVTVNGGTIGKEETCLVLLKDSSVSKIHAAVSYRSEGPDDHHYFIQDKGSNNGTFVKGQRLSESRIESHIVELGHGWNIQCGSVCLTCHIHPGHLTCNSCEPGLVIDLSQLKKPLIDAPLNTESKERVRRRQNKNIRKKFALNWHDNKDKLPSNPLYKDRATERRDTVGSENPYQKTEVASIDTNLSKSNKGFKLLEKMGWSEGQGLGLKQDGIIQPVVPVVPFGRTCLGGVPSLYCTDVSSKKSLSKCPEKISLIDFTPGTKDET